jgi:hypothetical protein
MQTINEPVIAAAEIPTETVVVTDTVPVSEGEPRLEVVEVTDADEEKTADETTETVA